jgi:hypothetical protein
MWAIPWIVRISLNDKSSLLPAIKRKKETGRKLHELLEGFKVLQHFHFVVVHVKAFELNQFAQPLKFFDVVLAQTKNLRKWLRVGFGGKFERLAFRTESPSRRSICFSLVLVRSTSCRVINNRAWSFKSTSTSLGRSEGISPSSWPTQSTTFSICRVKF